MGSTPDIFPYASLIGTKLSITGHLLYNSLMSVNPLVGELVFKKTVWMKWHMLS
jgi:hypothetical protein